MYSNEGHTPKGYALMAQAQQAEGDAFPRQLWWLSHSSAPETARETCWTCPLPSPLPRKSDSAALGQSPVICISNKCCQEAPMLTSCNPHLRDWPIGGSRASPAGYKFLSCAPTSTDSTGQEQTGEPDRCAPGWSGCSTRNHGRGDILSTQPGNRNHAALGSFPTSAPPTHQTGWLLTHLFGTPAMSHLCSILPTARHCPTMYIPPILGRSSSLPWEITSLSFHELQSTQCCLSHLTMTYRCPGTPA